MAKRKQEWFVFVGQEHLWKRPWGEPKQSDDADLPLEKSNLWVRNLKLEWLIPTFSFCFFISFPSLRGRTRCAKLWIGMMTWRIVLHWTMKVHGCPQLEVALMTVISWPSAGWRGIILFKCLVYAWQGFRHVQSGFMELVLNHCGYSEKSKDVLSQEGILASRGWL